MVVAIPCISRAAPNISVRELADLSSKFTIGSLKLQFLTVSRVSTRFSDQTSKTVDFCRNNAEFDTISSLVIKPNP